MDTDRFEFKFPQALGLCALLCCAATPCAAAQAASSATTVYHDLRVRIEPAAHSLSVRDRLHVPAALVTPDFGLLLNAALRVRTTTPGVTLLAERRVPPETQVRVIAYRLAGVRSGRDLNLDLIYNGTINYPIEAHGQRYARGSSESPGLIEERGVYLAGATSWIPKVQDALVTYRLEADLPLGWKSVSQGMRLATKAKGVTRPSRAVDVWRVDTPTEEIHLVAARFTEYERDEGPAQTGAVHAGAVQTFAFLRTPDAALAGRYLEAAAQYLQMYRDMLGPYPYGKFALVENFWETGYGMPSFTLLGEQIIRFPFILTSSFPHELLHNWWGNSVFVNHSGGNWCEGLTAYLADHLIAEQRGQGSAHRRDILQSVADYVTPAEDFPLTEFRSRNNAVTEAIGYGKAAMVWNMLRERVGDELFLKSLRRFYRDQLFNTAGFDDIRRSFEAESGQDLRAFFRQWVTQKGLPELRLDAATRDGNRLRVTLSQAQGAPLLAMNVPVAIYTAHGVELRTITLTDDRTTVTSTFDLDTPATRVEIDPQFQAYRRLSPLETAPSLSRAFGAGKVLIVVPAGPAAGLYAGLVKSWSRPGVEVLDDSTVPRLPHDRPVWIIGKENRFAAEVFAALDEYGAALDASELRVEGATYPTLAKSIVTVVRDSENPRAVRVFLTAPSAAAADGLARKLPHYGKYSWLIFGGAAPDNEAKGEWPTTESPLARQFDANIVPAKLPERKALCNMPAVIDTQRTGEM